MEHIVVLRNGTKEQNTKQKHKLKSPGNHSSIKYELIALVRMGSSEVVPSETILTALVCWVKGGTGTIG